jgi:glycosyltransferase involved in cell wall biosynthesis
MIKDYLNNIATNDHIEVPISSEAIIISIVMPIRNEEKYIDDCIASLLKQDFPMRNLEIILVDGDSNDKTCEIIESYMQTNSNIKLLHNPNKTVPYAMNTGIRAAQGKYIVRLDAHSKYARDYITKCFRYLEETGADNVGGPMIAKGKSNMQKIIAASYYSPFALGGGKFHNENYEGEVDTVYLGAFKKSTLFNVGLFDEKFTRNQDDELNYRIIKNNGNIFMTPQIQSEYYPRSSLAELFSQYFQYGEWKVAVLRKHGKPARLTHLIPAAFIICNVLGIVLSFVFKIILLIYLTVLGLYVVLILYYSFKNEYIEGFTNRMRLSWVHVILHISYGMGFIKGIFTK